VKRAAGAWCEAAVGCARAGHRASIAAAPGEGAAPVRSARER
jgi:hypothetical protein